MKYYRYHIKISDASGTRPWKIIAARSSDAGRIALQLDNIVGPFRMITRRAA